MANDETGGKLTRRRAVAGGLAAATVAALGAAGMGSGKPESTRERQAMQDPSNRLPVVYLPHGGGPFSYVEMGVPAAEVDALAAYWRAVGTALPTPPKALLVISAHWEERVPTVMTAERPEIYYDYYNFPPAAYQIQWPAPGDPRLASRVRALLGDAGFETAEDDARGFDHGTFIPLGRAFPAADVPTVQLSLKAGLHPEEHIAMGNALAPLRSEGVYILGSGMSYHNMRAFNARSADADAEAFDTWLRETALLPSAQRDARLAAWERAPAARRVHPREEHLMPLMVIAGAAGDDTASVPYNGRVFGKRCCGIQFG